MHVDTNIKFNQDEQYIISLIKDIINRYTPSTKAYIVGGFVRDNITGIPSNDIDIMLSNISGEDFAKLITKHLNIKDPHVIKENPEASKHITTAKSYIPVPSGKIQEIDFAQSRKEVYNPDSRIPQISDATPEEDALRRDFTINTVFYDIMNNKIVDFSGKGIQDLITNTLRTPLDPLKTFQEDPLRILRAIRFAAKYSLKIDKETYRAMKDPSLQDMIRNKISRERIGQEIEKTLKNPNANYALQLLKDIGLWDTFISESVRGSKYEGQLSRTDMPQENPNHKLDLWAHTMAVIQGVIDKYRDAEPEKRIVMILAALMHDIGKTYTKIWGESKTHPGHRSYHGHEEESAKIVELILKYLKMEPYIKEVSRLAQYHMRPHVLIRDEGGARSLRKFIRQIGEVSLNWLDVFNLAVADAQAKDIIQDPKITKEYKILEQKLQEALSSLSTSIRQDTSIKPILDGFEIMKILNINAGPHMKEIKEFVRELKDENPNITKEEAAQKLKEKYQNIKIASEELEQKPQEENTLSGYCSIHLLNQKLKDLNELIKNKKYYEAYTILKQLKEKYSNDENICRLISIFLLKILIAEKNIKDIDLLQFIFNKAKENFFDSILCSYVFGILICIRNKCSKNNMIKIGNRVLNMNPEVFKKVIQIIEKSKCELYHPDIYEKFKDKLNG